MGGHLTLQNAEGGGMEAQIHLRCARSDLGQKTEQRLQRPAIKRQLARRGGGYSKTIIQKIHKL